MRRAALALMLLVLGGALAAAPGPRTPDPEALAAARREARQATLRSEQFERAAAQATDQAARARAQAEALVAKLEAAEADLTVAEARIAIVERLQVEQRARLAEAQTPLVRLTGALQTLSRRPPALALVQPGSVEDVVHVRSLLAAALPEIRRRTAAVRSEVERGEMLRAQAEQARQALLDSREALQRRRVALAELERRQRERSQNLAGLAISESDRALAFGEEARALARLIGTREYQDRLRSELAELPGPVPRPGSAGSAGAAPAAAPYLIPVEGRVVRGVGEISDAGVHARGLTFATAPGARVVTPASGRVLHAGPFRSYGRIVIIDHGRGWSTVITDLAEIRVQPGQTVRRGELLGQAGGGDAQVSVELRRGPRPVPIAQLVAG